MSAHRAGDAYLGVNDCPYAMKSSPCPGGQSSKRHIFVGERGVHVFTGEVKVAGTLASVVLLQDDLLQLLLCMCPQLLLI